MTGWFPWLVVLFAVGVLLYWTYVNDDCINGKQCLAYVAYDPSDPPNVIKTKISEMIEKAQSPLIWPLALAVALATGFPLVYFAMNGNPTLQKVFAAVLFIFIGVYFTFSWSITHFYAPNLQRIQDAVDLL